MSTVYPECRYQKITAKVKLKLFLQVKICVFFWTKVTKIIVGDENLV